MKPPAATPARAQGHRPAKPQTPAASEGDDPKTDAAAPPPEPPADPNPTDAGSRETVPKPDQPQAPAELPAEPPLFGSVLEPVLRGECAGRLSAVSWFRTDWQRGGALTGYATYQNNGDTQQVVVKLPVPPVERDWLVRLSDHAAQHHDHCVTPRVFAHGEALNGYDLAWVVMEHVPHGPLGAAWQGHEFDLLVDAAGRFYAAADTTPPPDDAACEPRDWDDLLRRARDKVKSKDWPKGQVWKQALKHASKKLDQWSARWDARPVTGWCHGDLHLGNAMCRQQPPEETDETLRDDTGHVAVLLDLAHVRPGHWVEDAVYAEHLYWSRRDRLGGRKLVSLIAKARRTHGLPVGDDWSDLADLKRKLLALATPVTIAHHGGGEPHLDAALAVLS